VLELDIWNLRLGTYFPLPFSFFLSILFVEFASPPMPDPFDDFEDDIARVSGQALDFEANAYYKKKFTKISLQKYLEKGKWVVLVFYPLDFTGVCSSDLKEFSRIAKKFETEGAQIIGISVDSHFAHQAWCKGELGDINFPLVSDLTKDIAMDYDVLHDDGMALRATFIIDPKGTIHHSTINNLPIGRNPEETLRTLQAAKTGKACPAKWKKGEKTM